MSLVPQFTITNTVGYAVVEGSGSYLLSALVNWITHMVQRDVDEDGQTTRYLQMYVMREEYRTFRTPGQSGLSLPLAFKGSSMDVAGGWEEHSSVTHRSGDGPIGGYYTDSTFVKRGSIQAAGGITSLVLREA